MTAHRARARALLAPYRVRARALTPQGARLLLPVAVRGTGGAVGAAHAGSSRARTAGRTIESMEGGAGKRAPARLGRQDVASLQTRFPDVDFDVRTVVDLRRCYACAAFRLSSFVLGVSVPAETRAFADRR